MAHYIDIHTHHIPSSHPSPRSVGIHPWDAEKAIFDEALFLEAQLIGECGLDFACGVDSSAQERLFREQLSLAERWRRPVVLHCVRAFEPMMKILGEYRLVAVIFHGFIGSRQQAERAVARGYYLSFGEGAFRSPRTMEAIRSVPIDNIFAETDESSLPIETIYERIAETKGVSLEELQEKIEENYNKIFSEYNDK